MKLVYQFPMRALKHWDAWIGDHALADIAVAAEANGFDMVSTTDHPFPEHEWIENGGHHAFDPFVALSFMAAATTRVRLLTFILVGGYRSPYVTAKATATLDRLSGGRLVTGMGAGYQRAEFDVLGSSFTDRGPRLDAAITAIQAAWTGDVVDRDDEFFPAHGHVMLPRPLQQPGPPIWIGGNSKAAMRRVAELADGWLPFEQPATMAQITSTPALNVDDLGERILLLKEMRVAAGRDAHVDVCFSPHLPRDPEAAAEALSDAIPLYESSGVTHTLIESKTRSYDDAIREIELLGQLAATPAHG